MNQHRFPTRTALPISMLLLLAAACPAAEAWHVVAADSAGKAGHLQAGQEYTFTDDELPPGAVKSGDPLRRVLFDKTLQFGYSGLKKGAAYKVKMTFLTERPRVERISIDGKTVREALALKQGPPIVVELPVPAAAADKGSFSLEIEMVSGPNALVSLVQVLSTDPAALSAGTPQKQRQPWMHFSMPRLSPRPAAVAGSAQPQLSLNGTWRFHPAPPAGFEKLTADAVKAWKTIEVPGEWVMQGFEVKPNTPAGYWREFDLPEDWAGKRVKLRFDTVHSDCKVFLNGQPVGAHEGGFVPFELDVTAVARPGANTLALAVTSESTCDTLASASQYAAHPLGGITRKVTAFALPACNLAGQWVTTPLSADCSSGTLRADLQIANEAATEAGDVAIAFALTAPDGAAVPLTPARTTCVAVKPGQTVGLRIDLPVAAPQTWDPEHPRLYTLVTSLLVGGAEVQRVSQRVGLRQIELRGNQVYVNGSAVQLRGSNRHEAHPLRGRSLTPELWRRDAELFRSANLNYVRTSHYPPAEEFLDACDELGLFVECEAALCWVQHGANSVWQNWNYQDARYLPLLVRANLENIAANRNHPCILIWSLANESRWSPLFARVLAEVRRADPSRPNSFHDQSWGEYNNAASRADIANYHYPGENGPAACDKGERAQLFGEYAHVQTYNRGELSADPGVRDDWGRGIARMYDLMHQHEGCLGGAIWAGIDDVFCLPNGKFVGYGMWGCICDGWRREKPEYWHIKKSYSPIRVTGRELPLPAAGQPIRVGVQNRYGFTNLNEVKIAWSIGDRKGQASADVAPGQTGEIVIAAPGEVRGGDKLALGFTDPRGFMCESELLTIGAGQSSPAGPAPAGASPAAPSAGPRIQARLTQTDKAFRLEAGEVVCEVARDSGQLTASRKGKPIITGGPVLMVLPLKTEACSPVDLGQWPPLNATCQGWAVKSVSGRQEAGEAAIAVDGAYAEAEGGYRVRFDAAGVLVVDYAFTSKADVNPRQWGVVFYAPRDTDTLSWKRKAQWTVYPADHIGRPEGSARANVAPDNKPYASAPPAHAWSQDATPLGGHDFSSTKAFIYEAGLRAPDGRAFGVTSDARQSVRAFVDGRRIALLVAGFHTGGGDMFFSTHMATERRPLKKGAKIADSVKLTLAGGE